MQRNERKFAPGVRGNRAGRPKGVQDRWNALRASLAEHVPGVISKVVEKALDGDMAVARILFDRVLPTLKPQHPVAQFKLGDGSLSNLGRDVLGAIADCKLTLDAGRDHGSGTIAEESAAACVFRARRERRPPDRMDADEAPASRCGQA
jgi:hypothetical protein